MTDRTRQNHNEALLRVVVYIQRHLDSELTLKDLASKAHFSPCHFHRLFHNLTGEAVMEHIRRLRLERAAYRLKTTSIPIINIAFTTGYETHEAFTRAFRNKFAVSPCRFRSDNTLLSFLPIIPDAFAAPAGHFPDYAASELAINEDEIDIREIKPTKVAFVRKVGPYGSGWLAWKQMLAWAKEHKLLKKGTRLIGLRHDCTNITPPNKCRYDACIPVDNAFVPNGEIGVQTIGGGKYAVVDHRGHYGTRFAVYDYLCNQWVPDHRRILRAAPVIEVYLRDLKANIPQNVITKIHVPLEQ